MPETHLESVKRITDVLDYLVAHPEYVSISELSRELGYNKSVIHRLLTALEAHDYLVADPKSRRYQLGPRILQLGLVVLDRLDIRGLALPRMERLLAETRETVTLSVRDRDYRVYVESLGSPQEIRMSAQLGRRLPLYLGGSSKAMLAFLPASDRERILDSAKGALNASGERLSIDRLRADIEVARARGYVVSRDQRVIGAFSISAPIFNHQSEVVGAISVAGPTSRWRDALATQYGELVLREALGLSRDLGYRGETIGAGIALGHS